VRSPRGASMAARFVNPLRIIRRAATKSRSPHAEPTNPCPIEFQSREILRE